MEQQGDPALGGEASGMGPPGEERHGGGAPTHGALHAGPRRARAHTPVSLRLFHDVCCSDTIERPFPIPSFWRETVVL